jgi:hypothetical protein
MWGKSGWMTGKSLCVQTLMVGLLLLSGCDVARSARGDLSRLVSSDPSKPHSQRAATRTTPKPTPATQTSAVATPTTPSATEEAKAEPPKDSVAPPPVNLIGKSENEVRALFGPPTTVEERAPGKTWRYRNGTCSLDVQLYPDVQTRQFGTLAYEVKSNDNTDEGNRACLAQLRAHGQSGG